MSDILIVDDEQNVQLVLKTIFEIEGYNVITASNAKEALTLLNQVKPKAAIIDVMMPEISGIELINKINENNSNIKIIILSVLSMTECWEKFIEPKYYENNRTKEKDYSSFNNDILENLGVHKFITKPFDNKKIVELVRNLIKK